MREFTNTLAEELRYGLVPDARNQKRSPYLIDGRGFTSTSFGLVGTRDYTALGNTNVVLGVPQVFNAGGRTFLLETDGRILEWAVNDSLTPVPILTNTGTSYIPATIGQFHIADAGKAFFLFSGAETIYNARLSPFDEIVIDSLRASSYPIKSGIFHKGRFIVGGLNGWPEKLLDFLTAQLHGTDVEFNLSDELGLNTVLWGSPGGGDFPLWLLSPPEVEFDLSPTATRILERLRANTWGYSALPDVGEILLLLPAGPYVYIFGSKAIYRMENGITPGFEKVASIGLFSRCSAVAGFANRIYFITEDGSLWYCDHERRIRRLGFREYFRPARDAGLEIFGSYNAADELLHFSWSNGTTIKESIAVDIARRQFPAIVRNRVFYYSYVETEVGPRITRDDSGLATKDQTTLLSTSQDFGLRSIKTLTGIAIGYTGEANPEVAIQYRYSSGGSWQQTPWTIFNRENHATVRVAGTDFRVALRGLGVDFSLSHLQLKWQSSDNRTIRGPYADVAMEPSDFGDAE